MWGQVAGPFARVPVEVAWTRQPDPYALWEGRVSGGEELVGLAVTVYDDTLHWQKTTRRGAWSDAGPGLYVGLWMSEDARGSLSGRTNVQLRLPGAVYATYVRTSPGAPLSVAGSYVGRTGELMKLVSVGGERPAAFGVLFLCRRDVEVVRKGSWRLRPRLRGGLQRPFDVILPGARRGEVALGKRDP